MAVQRARRTSSSVRTVLAFAWATAFLVVPAGGTTHLQSDFAESGLVTIRSLIDVGRYSDAESAAEALVAADPKDSRSEFYLAEALSDLE